MGGHDSYGKSLLKRVLGSRFDNWADSRSVMLGDIAVSLDGVITEAKSHRVVCAVEIEAENEKQIRSAVLNLFLHPAPKALLVLMPSNLNNPVLEVLEHLQELWKRLTGGNRGALPVVCLMGDGNHPAFEEDEARITDRVMQLGIGA
jgi:hypothetical protein